MDASSMLPAVAVFVLVVAALGGTAWAVLRARARRALRRLAKATDVLNHPVVLAHGLMGFDEVALGPIRQEYFRGVPAKLRSMGHQVHVIKLPPTATVAARAAALVAAVRLIDAPKVHIVAHSMGGLDARYAISRLGLAEKVATLVTIGTPHRGTPLADVGAGLGQKLGVFAISRALSVDVGAIEDLTRKRMAAFNAQVPDDPDVVYASFIGVADRSKGAINPLLLPSWVLLSKTVGENDGIVPAESQRWGEVVGTVAADHWAQIGWSRSAQTVDLFQDVIRFLRERELRAPAPVTAPGWFRRAATRVAR